MLVHYDEIKGLGGEVLAVSFTGPDRLKAYLDRHPLPCVIAGDPSLVAYKAFELGRTSLASLFNPVVMFRYLVKMLKGWFPEKHHAGEDILQLGGDFVLDEQRRFTFVYRSVNPTDRPGATQILEAVRRAAKATAEPATQPRN